MNWPIGSGHQFKGIYDRFNHRVVSDPPGRPGKPYLPLDEDGNVQGDNPLAGDGEWQDALDGMELLEVAGNELDRDKIAKGDQTPVFFGSAPTNFGVRTFLENYLQFAPHRVNTRQKTGGHQAVGARFLWLVFKIQQANMNPRHRDRIAFVRICSVNSTGDGRHPERTRSRSACQT